MLPLKDIKNWFLLISAEVHQASYLCQVIIIRFSRSNALMLVDIAKKLQYVIQNHFCSIIFSLPFYKVEICRGNQHLHSTIRIKNWFMTFHCGTHQNQENLTNGVAYFRGFRFGHFYAHHTHSTVKNGLWTCFCWDCKLPSIVIV